MAAIVMSALIILVNDDPRALRHTEDALSDEGYLVAALRSVADARRAIESTMPDLLIADLSLHAEAGLALAIRSRVDHPDVPVIVTHANEDTFAEADATYYGASFISAPLTNPRFLPCVRDAIERRRSRQPLLRRWSRHPAAGVVEVTAANSQAQIIDLSYGGVRLAFRATRQGVPETFTIALPTDVLVQARRVWTVRSQVDAPLCQCGAQLSAASEDPWRQFVNALRDSPVPSAGEASL